MMFTYHFIIIWFPFLICCAFWKFVDVWFVTKMWTSWNLAQVLQGLGQGFMSTIFPVAWGPVLGPTVMFRWQNRAEKKVEKGILHVGIATEDMKLPRSADYGWTTPRATLLQHQRLSEVVIVMTMWTWGFEGGSLSWEVLKLWWVCHGLSNGIPESTGQSSFSVFKWLIGRIRYTLDTSINVWNQNNEDSDYTIHGFAWPRPCASLQDLASVSSRDPAVLAHVGPPVMLVMCSTFGSRHLIQQRPAQLIQLTNPFALVLKCIKYHQSKHWFGLGPHGRFHWTILAAPWVALDFKAVRIWRRTPGDCQLSAAKVRVILRKLRSLPCWPAMTCDDLLSRRYHSMTRHGANILSLATAQAHPEWGTRRAWSQGWRRRRQRSTWQYNQMGIDV